MFLQPHCSFRVEKVFNVAWCLEQNVSIPLWRLRVWVTTRGFPVCEL